MENTADNVFEPDAGENSLLARFFAGNDYAPKTRRAFVNDLGKFTEWFVQANREPFRIQRVTTADITSFRDHLRREKEQAVNTVNRAINAVRAFFTWLVESGEVASNPAKKVKQLRVQQLAPKGLERPQVRRLLREVELRGDIRANAIFHLFLFTGCRVGDLVQLSLADLMISERSGSVVFNFGKGNKQRSVPLPLPARRAIQEYLETRPPVQDQQLFAGQRGPMTDRGIRELCNKYTPICGFKIHPHLLRHTMAHRFLEDSGNDLVSLAQILGHESLNTTARYTKRGHEQLAAAADKVAY